jgi:sulfur carrier protein
MLVRLNGRTETLPEGGLLTDALVRLGVEDPRGVAVALDGEVVPRGSWATTPLHEGQAVEVLRAVQGG